MHWRWLSDQRFAFAHQQFVYEEYKRRIHELEERCVRLEQVLEEAVLDWPLCECSPTKIAPPDNGVPEHAYRPNRTDPVVRPNLDPLLKMKGQVLDRF